MASGALFGNASSRSKSKNLVEFKAGKMYLKGNMCHPDKRKGLLYVYQADDSLMHFCWRDRSTGAVEEDLIIFPDDVEFKNVPQCKTGRVYVLKFKASSRKYIFWMQEAKNDKDEDNCRKVNEALNNPPTPSASRAGGGSGLPAEIATLTGDNDLQTILGSMSQQQLLQLLGGMSGAGPSITTALLRGSGGRPASSSQASTADEPPASSLSIRSSPGPQSRAATDGGEGLLPRPATVAAISSTVGGSSFPSPLRPTAAGGVGGRPAVEPSPPVQQLQPAVRLSDLQDILATVMPAAAPPAAAGRQDPQVETASSTLKDALSSSLMVRVLTEPSVQLKLQEFASPGVMLLLSTERSVRDAAGTPAFEEIARAFNSALRSRQLASVLAPLNFPETAVQAASEGDVEAFAKAVMEATSADTKMEDN